MFKNIGLLVAQLTLRWRGEWLSPALAVGVFLLAGLTAQRVAGPAALLAFAAAAFAALFAALCCAELRWRVRSARSAYAAAAVCVGELAAFFLGWILILEGLFGACVAAKGLGLSVDWLTGHRVLDWMRVHVPIASPYFGTYFDILSFAFVLALGETYSAPHVAGKPTFRQENVCRVRINKTFFNLHPVLLLIGARTSAALNNVLAVPNVLVILFVVIAGALYADSSYWWVAEGALPGEGQTGAGGFFPFGAWGVLRGVALAFYGYVGYDTVAAVGVAKKEPRRFIPFALLISLGVSFACYGGVVIVLTMMLPYYQIPGATIAEVFVLAGAQWQSWVVGAGAVFGLCTSLLNVMSVLPRVVRAMASDRLLPRFMGNYSGKLIPTAVAAVLAGVFELELLLLMMCISALLSHGVVAIYVLLLRYQHEADPAKAADYSQSWFVCTGKRPTRATYAVVAVCVGLFVTTCISTALVGCLVADALIPAIALHALAAVLFILIAIQPRNNPDIAFKTPLVPLVPCLCIYVNINLMILVDLHSWIRVVVGVFIGVPIYIICICVQKQKKKLSHLEGNVNEAFTSDMNGKLPIEITVESPTPPESIRMNEIVRAKENKNINTIQENSNDQNLKIQQVHLNEPKRQDEIVIQHAAIEINEEKEAKIIDLLDQVLQAEEDSFGEISSLPEQSEETEIIISASQEPLPHRKSVSELSDTGSDASISDTRHDVVAQVHREDLPTVDEERQRKFSEDKEDEKITYFGIRETNSPTDESGYSDSTENIPDSNESINEKSRIPTPPPFDESLLATSPFKKSFTIPARPIKPKPEPEIEKPRESLQSNSSQDDIMIFGSPRQLNFMSKLDNIYHNKINNTDGNNEPRIRSKSVENVFDNDPGNLIKDRSNLFLDLKKELLEKEPAQILKPVSVKEGATVERTEKEENEDEDSSLSRADLKSKLEVILATGGPVLLKPRLMKSNPPTPEEVAAGQTAENLFSKVPNKSDKNDTLKRQRAKFGEVLNSFRLSFNKDDEV
ncbi:High affinity cationic amino acid transporter 1 [Eumeta japonica]|uniref:High affinity cationic amino acid transporter 1 n=1 Tax=Eumeta variegata TaxID=151549 RepID=A0A4C1V4X4_EUMVA|nr:High affinity cationic amino acid transporter 1 [Eumeta japonica]